MSRVRIPPSELQVGDVLPDPHLSGKPGKVTRVAPTWYGASISYEYDGLVCMSAVFENEWAEEHALYRITPGVEVER